MMKEKLLEIKRKQIQIFITNIEKLRKSQGRKYYTININSENIFFNLRGEKDNKLSNIYYCLSTFKYSIYFRNRYKLTKYYRILKKEFFYILENLSILDLFYINKLLKQIIINNFKISL